MIYFVTGASGSGKSDLAEDICESLGGSLVYIATMPIASEESEKKAERHKKRRAGKGFSTIERPDLLAPLPENSTVLLECVSTYTANRMFSEVRPEADPEKLFEEIKALAALNKNLVIVSAEVGWDGICYDEYTESYKRVLSALNVLLADFADTAAESVYGIPNVLKGDLSCLKA